MALTSLVMYLPTRADRAATRVLTWATAEGVPHPSFAAAVVAANSPWKRRRVSKNWPCWSQGPA